MPRPLPAARALPARAIARPVNSALATALAATVALGALGALAGCGDSAESVLPRAEFVMAAGDSSIWVLTGPDAGPTGIDVRRAPITLALLDGRFHELYVTEDDYSFRDALFAAQTVWRRDLVTGDSIVVHGDATAPTLAVAYGRRHPDERPLGLDDEVAEEPSVLGVTEAWVVDVHGPFATVESYADLHPEEGEPSHRVRLRVVDLRRGAELSLAELLGAEVSAGVVARGRAAFAAAPGRLGFDERSFTFAGVGAGPGVVFHVPGTGDEDDGQALPPIGVPGGAWWDEARDGMPVETTRDDVPVATWRRGPLAVEAHRERDGDRLVLRDSTGRAWRIASVGDEVQRVYWLDGHTGARHRAALARAFYEATLYDGTFRAVSHTAVAGSATAARAGTRPITQRR